MANRRKTVCAERAVFLLFAEGFGDKARQSDANGRKIALLRGVLFVLAKMQSSRRIVAHSYLEIV